MRPMSLRARSISITCSARSLGSATNSVSTALSCPGDAARTGAHARGRMVIFSSAAGMLHLLLAHQDFGRSPHNPEAPKVVVIHVGAGD